MEIFRIREEGGYAMQEKKWIYLIHLSTNMWGDPGSNFIYKPYFDTFHTDEEIWRKTIDFLPAQGFNSLLIDVGDAIQYESHPEIAIAGAWSKEKMKKELDYIRSIGLTPLPKLNFSTCHDAWMGEYSRMVSTKQYYQFCDDVIDEVCELFDYPQLFHLGMDEEGLACQKEYSICHIRFGDLWWHDVYKLFNACDRNGVRPWVWADPCWKHPDVYLKKMPKSVMQSNWWYDPMPRAEDGTFEDHRPGCYQLLEKAGYDQIPTCSSTWSYQFNTGDTLREVCSCISNEHLKGVIAAPWQLTTQEDYYTLLDEANRFGLAKRKYFPDAPESLY